MTRGKIGSRIHSVAAKVWGSIQWRSRDAYERAVVLLAKAYRPLLFHVAFIDITGSGGKTTTKELISEVLSRRFRVHKSPGNSNHEFYLAETILGVRPWDQCCVLEVSVAVPGAIAPFESYVKLTAPRIGVVTNIGDDHISLFGTRDVIAAHKGKLIAGLSKGGVAILNADDPLVLGMQAQCKERVMTYGLSAAAMVRAKDVRSHWPESLSFTVVYNGQTQFVQTQLYGTHWVHCVLAGFATALAMDMDLATIAQAVADVPPFEARLSPLRTADGVTFIRDDYKAPAWTIAPTLQFMKDATAKRKIIIMGTISDYIGNSKRSGSIVRAKVYESVARESLESADQVIFIGTQASKCLKARRHPQDESLQAFYSVDAAREYLSKLFRPGDLVLLKGTHRQDHLVDITKIPLTGAAVNPIAPQASEGVMPAKMDLSSTKRHTQANSEVESSRGFRAVIGLGNAGEKFRETRHNIGQRVLDRVAESLGSQWQTAEDALLARVEQGKQTVYLIKPLTNLNNTGPIVRQVAERLGFGPAECILIHDDINLPVGAIRARAGGGDGGHRGVRSLHQTFLTDAIYRVKIGIGRPEQNDSLEDYVLSPFDEHEFPSVEQASAKAVTKVLEVLAKQLPIAEKAAS